MSELLRRSKTQALKGEIFFIAFQFSLYLHSYFIIIKVNNNIIPAQFRTVKSTKRSLSA